MAEEDHRTVSTRATEGSGGGADPRDDWLAADAGDLDWFPGDDPQGAGAPGSRTNQGAGRGADRPQGGGASGGSPWLEDLNEFFRKRGTLIVLVAAVAVIILVAILVFGGGGGTSTPPATTPPATTGVTTTATTPPSTKPASTTPAQTAPTITLPPVGYLRSGDTGTQVKNLQKALILLGSTTLKADGNFGPATATAVTAFQKANGLTADGVVGQKTVDAIDAALASQG
jgi:hypothetical protein